MAISDYHRLESDAVDNMVEKHFHHHQRGTLLHDHDYQTGFGSMYKSVYKVGDALTLAWEHASCESYTYAGRDSVRLNLVKGVCDTCRECRAWDMPGHTVIPSDALPGKFQEEVECDMMFYKQENQIFHIIDRCIRYATGIGKPDKTMTSILDAYHQCWM
eukprot:820523-Pyramimonas_sp.AAC.1